MFNIVPILPYFVVFIFQLISEIIPRYYLLTSSLLMNTEVIMLLFILSVHPSNCNGFSSSLQFEPLPANSLSSL